MYERSSSLVLRWLKVPPAPHPPMGDPASLRVFHAGRNYFNLRLAGWGVAQLLAFAGIVFWVVMFLQIEEGVALRRQSGQTLPHPPTSARNFDAYVKAVATDLQSAVEGKEDGNAPSPAATPVDKNASPVVAPADKDAKPAEAPLLAPANKEAKPAAAPAQKPKRPRVRINGWEGFKRLLIDVALLLPLWTFPVLWVLKVLGFIAYLVQIPITYAVRRLDYEMRWYMVTDRSLRIRHGVWRVFESTMSFANIQQVIVSQGPLQRLLGLADVRVQSAGGGDHSSPHAQDRAGEDMHSGLFHGVTNATEIRDLILERLRRFRDSGLGDPEESRRAAMATTALSGASAAAAAASVSTPIAASPELIAAARELASEARALHAALG